MMKKSYGCRSWWSLKNRFYVLIVFPVLTFISLILLTMVLTSHHSSASAEVLEVDDSGSKDYYYIQDAVENATNGDTILVYPGSYYENVYLNKTLNITGVDRETTVIVPEYISAVQVYVERCILSNITFDGKQLVSGERRKGIYLYGDHTRIINCTFKDLDDGLMDSSSVNTSVSYCKFIDNDAGIYFQTCSNVRISNCEFDSNNVGFRVEHGDDIRIEDCQFRNCRPYGIFLENASNDLVVLGCSFRDSGKGLLTSSDESSGLCNGNISYCSFLNNEVGIKIFDGPQIIFKCRLNGNGFGIIIFCNGNVVKECTISNSKSNAITLNGDQNTITWNHIENSGEYGILSEYELKKSLNIIENNTFRNNSKGDIGEVDWSDHSILAGMDVFMTVMAGIVVVGWKKRRRKDGGESYGKLIRKMK